MPKIYHSLYSTFIKMIVPNILLFDFQLKSKITKQGYLIYKSELTRSQQLNLADCLEKIRNIIYETLVEKSESSLETEERIRRRIENAAKERLILKKQKSLLKNDRRGPVDIL